MLCDHLLSLFSSPGESQSTVWELLTLSNILIWSCVLHCEQDRVRSLDLDSPTTTNIQVNQLKSLVDFFDWRPRTVHNYAVWQSLCCCCSVGLLSPFILQCHLHNFSCNAEGQIKLHQPNISTEVLFCIVLHQTFWLSSVIVRKIQNFQHLVFRKIPQQKIPKP